VNGITSAGIALALAALMGAAPAVAAPPKADLAVGALSGVPASVTAGGAIDLRYKVANKGGRRAPASRLALFLSADARADKGDVALGGGKVKAVRAHKSRTGHVAGTVPAGVHAGAYQVLACADAAGNVREASERNNCRVAGRVSVAAGGGPAPSGGPGSPTGPVSSPDPTPTPSPSPDPTPSRPPRSCTRSRSPTARRSGSSSSASTRPGMCSVTCRSPVSGQASC
jgi:hypothetical protein